MFWHGAPGHLAEIRYHSGEYCVGPSGGTLEEIQTAARAAHAHGFIRRLPDGYDTVIGETGGSLSQGQKQLLCIARVMLCLPPMLILDEATSSIDTRTEQKIQKAFAALMGGRTSFNCGPPAVNHSGGGSDSGYERRANHRAGDACVPVSPRRFLCRAVRESIRH